jgi:hypothetical protein
MKLSEKSISLLRNLSRVNKSVYLEKGQTQRAASPNSTVVCEVKLDEELPTNFGVHDMYALLNFLKACEEPDLTFTDTSVTIVDKNGWKAMFQASSKELINVVESMEEIDAAPSALEFDLPSETLKRMIDLASVNSLPQIAFMNGPEGLIMKAFEKSVNDSTNITIGLPFITSLKTPFVVSTVNMKIEVDSYRVKITEMGFAKFESLTTDRRYVICTEMESD